MHYYRFSKYSGVALLVTLVVFSVIWVIYFLSTKFTRVITIADKYSKTRQTGTLQVDSDNSGVSVIDTRDTIDDFYIKDTDRKLYRVGDCILCGFYLGAHGKYAALQVGDRIEIKGYGGKFTGVADVYGVKRLP